MRLFYSGHAGGQRDQKEDWDPELVLGPKANVMVSYQDFAKRSVANRRFKRILLCRIKGKKKCQRKGSTKKTS